MYKSHKGRDTGSKGTILIILNYAIRRKSVKSVAGENARDKASSIKVQKVKSVEVHKTHEGG